MKNKRMNDKGFSLVELIVVIAIMAILAVTLAPRFMRYVDDARVAHDQQTVNSIFTAAQVAYMQEPAAFQTADTLFTGADDNVLQLRVIGATNPTSTLYGVSADGATWTIDNNFPNISGSVTNAFTAELQATIGNFNLQSGSVGAGTQITIALVSGRIQVTLDYNGTGYVAGSGDIQVTE